MRTSQWVASIGTACLAALAALAALAGCSSAGGGAPSGSAAPDTAADSTHDTTLGPPTSESVFLESADGVLALEVPAGLVREGTDLGIDMVDAAEVPGLEDVTPIGPAYRVRPVDLVLPEPLSAAFRVPSPDGGALPLVITLVEHGGVVGAEVAGRTRFDDAGAVEHRSMVDRFGVFVLVDAGVDIVIEPPTVSDLEPGDSFTASVMARATASDHGPWPGFDLELRWSASGATSSASAGKVDAGSVSAGDGDAVWTAEFTCGVAGGGTHGAELAVVPAAGGGPATRQSMIVLGASSCGDVGR